MKSNYDYNILKEEAQGLDEFELQTHEKIKCSIINLLNKESEGINIGLSGTWGSGKSTIIKLLINAKENRDKFIFFYFDAWAHEGDPLRRIFLESFINTLKESTKDNNIKETLEKKRKIISREEVIKTIKVDKTTTKLGVILSIATLIFTIGAAILSSINYENLTLGLKESINFPFLIAFILTLTPFFVIISNYFILKSNNLDPKDLKNWAFIHNAGTETISEEISEDEERTSIEFEKFFREIVEIFDNKANKKIILILDNLDRVEASLSLNIWSTLQTFIQHKNPATKDYSSFKNVFSIIPYDEESLKRIWNNHETIDTSNPLKISNNSNSFFDKSFQIRIDVPKPILSNWTSYLDKMIEKCMPNWSDKDKREMVQVLQLTRENVLDNPKPREIKIYLNQIAYFRNHFENEISTKSISFYVYKRFLKGLSNDDLASYLIDETKIQPNEFNLINEESIIELSAIIYGVNKSDGKQILIEQQIANAFDLSDSKLLNDVSDNFNHIFWSVFNNLTNRLTTLNNYLKYNVIINKAFIGKEEYLLQDYVLNFCKSIKNDQNYSDGINELLKTQYTSAIEFLLKYNKINEIKILCTKFIKSFEEADRKNEINQEGVIIFIDTISFITQNANITFNQKELNVRIEIWKQISIHPNYQQISKYFYPTNKNFIDVCNEISQGVIVNQNSIISLENSLHNDKLNFNYLLDKLKQHLFWNNGNQNINTVNYQVVLLFEKIYYRYINYDYNSILKSQFFYSYLGLASTQDQKMISRIAVLNACHFRSGLKDIKSFVPQNNARANQILLMISSYWISANNENAQFSYDILKNNNKLHIIWELTNNAEFNLVYDVIKLIIENKDVDVFNIENPFEVLQRINKKEQNIFEIKSLIDLFIKESNLVNNLVGLENINYLIDGYIFNIILRESNSKALIIKSKNDLLKIDKAIFIESFKNSSSIFSILFYIKEIDNSFILNNISDVLIDISNDFLLINKSKSELNELQKFILKNAISLLDKDYYVNYCNRISLLITNEKENLKEEFFEINNEFINIDLIAKTLNSEIEIFQNYIRDAIMDYNNKLGELKFINNIIKRDTNKTIKIKREFKSVLINSINEISETLNSDEVKTIINNIKKHFNIK